MHEEIKKAQEVTQSKNSDEKALLKSLLKLTELNIKLLHNIRANQTAWMKHENVPLQKPQREENSEKKEV
jgi:hypothetical protein